MVFRLSRDLDINFVFLYNIFPDPSLFGIGSCRTYWWTEKVVLPLMSELLHVCLAVWILILSLSNNVSVLMPPKLREMDDVIKMIHLDSILSNDSKQGDTLLVCSYTCLPAFLFDSYPINE